MQAKVGETKAGGVTCRSALSPRLKHCDAVSLPASAIGGSRSPLPRHPMTTTATESRSELRPRALVVAAGHRGCAGRHRAGRGDGGIGRAQSLAKPPHLSPVDEIYLFSSQPPTSTSGARSSRITATWF